MVRRFTALAVAAALLAFTSPGGAAQEAGDGQQASWEGLQKVRSKRVDQVWLRPGADFRGYTRVILEPIEVSFRRNWERDVDRYSRSASPRVTAEEVEQIRRGLSDGFGAILADGFSRAGYEIAPAPGPDVLRIRPVLIDVFINAPVTPRTMGRVDSFTLEAGGATMALEVRDSETGEILGRAVDQRRTGRTEWLTWTTNVSNRAEFERLFRHWASILVDGMASLKAASPVRPGGGSR